MNLKKALKGKNNLKSKITATIASGNNLEEKEVVCAIQTLELTDTSVAVDMESSIIVYNDDNIDIEHVIESFVHILNHSFEQAEQLAWLIHYKDKFKVKQGNYQILAPMCSAILNRGISAEIQ